MTKVIKIKKRGRGRPRKRGRPPLSQKSYKRVNRVGHKYKTIKNYNMKFTMLNPKMYPDNKPLFVETQSAKSNSTELNCKKTLLGNKKLEVLLSDSDSNIENQSRETTQNNSFCSLINKKEEQEHILNFSMSHVNHKNAKKKNFKLQCNKKCENKMEIKPLGKRAYFVNFKNERADSTIPNIYLGSSFISKCDIAVEFFQFASDFKNVESKELMFSGRLKKKNNFQFSIDYQLIEMTLLSFFKMKNIGPFMSKLNDYEYIYIAIFLFKKNFLKWSSYNIDVYELQKSTSKKRKEHFLKFLLMRNIFIVFRI